MPQKYATRKEAREARRVQNRIASKKRKAAAAIAAGRVPGRIGGQPKYLTDEERRAAHRAAVTRFRERNRGALRVADAAAKRAERRDRALAEGREPGRVGRVMVYTDAQRRDLRTEGMRKWRDNNPDKARALQRRTYLRNKDKIVARSRNRRLLKLTTGSYSPSDIHDLWEAQKRKCVFCLKGLRWGKFDIDHHVPLSRGGANDRSNLRLLHARCNRSKGARDPADHALRNGLLCW